MNLREFTEYLVKSIATEPDMVKVQEFGGEDDSVVLEVLVHESDMGAIIGKQGKMAKSLRTLVQAYAYLHDNKRVKINIDSF
jgi:predicted RNA-binding protein YlqC (UPF0109 family)